MGYFEGEFCNVRPYKRYFDAKLWVIGMQFYELSHT